LYQSKDLSKINFAEYVRNLGDHLLHSYGINSNTITLQAAIDDVFLGIDTAIPCGLIINELVSNSLKHAFPKGRRGEVRVELFSDDNDGFTLVVSDNGIGFPRDLDFRNTKSLGLQLVMDLVEQLDGNIELDRNHGTTFKITFT
jgi:two-component sensor histidine kinase